MKPTVPPFISSCTQRFDFRGRVSIPASFREVLAKSGTRGFYTCATHVPEVLDAFDKVVFEELYTQHASRSLSPEDFDLATKILQNYTFCESDKRGRVFLPQAFVSAAALTEAVTFVGMARKFQLWNPERWSAERGWRLEAALAARAMAIKDAQQPSLSLSGIIVPDRRTLYGVLVKTTTSLWPSIINSLNGDWCNAYSLGPEKWEELIAGAFTRAGFDEVVLTPRSGDFGRDVIAVKRGFGSIKIIGSVKAYRPGNLVSYDDIRALMGVLSSEIDASKGIIMTTSGFPPMVEKDPFIRAVTPTRLELVDGISLRSWLLALSTKGLDED